MSKQQLFVDIVGFLEQRIAQGEVAGDEKESLELAIDCIRETFHVSEDAKPQDLLAIYERAQSSGSSANSATTTTAAAAAAAASAATAAAATDASAVSEEDRKAADELKAQGNKLMAKHDFKGAADAYTEAIAKNPTNAVYFSNRAAAFTHLSLNARAVEDARQATELDPSYARAWSRLGLALWAQGEIKASLEAYETGLKAEGDNPSEAMKRDYEMVKKRYDEEQAKSDALSKSSNSKSADEEDSAESGAGAGAGGAGGFDFSQLMNNPQVKQMAQNFMSNPQALSSLMNNPMVQQLKDKFAGGGGMPDFSQLSKMMDNPDVQNMMKDFKK